MKFNIETIFPLLRIILCITLVIIWTTWLINLPDVQEQRTEVREKKQETRSKKQEEVEQSTQNKEQKVKQPMITQHSTRNDELPELAELEAPKPTTEQPKEVIENKITKNNSKQNPIILNLATFTQETRKVLQKTTALTEIPLRKEAHVNKKQYKPSINLFNQNSKQLEFEADLLDHSWLPKYILEEKKLSPKTESVINNLNQIASQLELAGLINNDSQEQAAIIRNKTNNKIEILKKGDEYQGLKLLQINKDEIILGNQNLNITYIKKIVTHIP